MKLEDLIFTCDGIVYCKVCGHKQETTKFKKGFTINSPFKHLENCVFEEIFKENGNESSL